MINEVHNTLRSVLARAEDLLKRNYIIIAIERFHTGWKIQACPTTSFDRNRRPTIAA